MRAQLRPWVLLGVVLTAVGGLGPEKLPPDSGLAVGAFSEASPGALPEGWSRLELKGIDVQTAYRVVEEDGRIVVQAESRGGASGLVREVHIDPATHPILTWTWKVRNVLEKGDVTRKKGDDYPARLYITFDYDPGQLSFGDRLKYFGLRLLGYRDIPLRALNYIWANKAEEGEIVPNPYTDWVMMIPVESGADRRGEWVDERRNLVEDYQAAFGEPPGAITGIAIMTDTDNTGEEAVAYYGDIFLRPGE